MDKFRGGKLKIGQYSDINPKNNDLDLGEINKDTKLSVYPQKETKNKDIKLSAYPQKETKNKQILTKNEPFVEKNSKGNLTIITIGDLAICRSNKFVEPLDFSVPIQDDRDLLGDY